jgi:hypothetical protein
MYKADQLAVEVHFIPLSAEDADERRQRLRTLLLRGARRLAQQSDGYDQRAVNSEATTALHFDVVQK